MISSEEGAGTLEFTVVDIDRRPVPDATIRTDVGTAEETGSGRFQIQNVPPGRYLVEVEARELAPDERWVDVVAGVNNIDVVLGEPGLPFFKRRGGRVPFRSPDDQLGVATRGSDGDRQLDDWAAERKLRIERPYGPGLAVVHVEPARLREYSAAIRELSGVVTVGRLVNPAKEGTGVLTARIVVKSVAGAEWDAVRSAAEAAEADLKRQLVLDDLWIVEAREPDGFGVLDTANRLERQKAFVAAEADVAFTSVTDTIIPGDRLYCGQWALQRVHAPDAWQHLRDAGAGGSPGNPADRTFGAADIVIGVIDTGVQSVDDNGVAVAAHPEFKGTVTNGLPKVVQFFNFWAMVPNNHFPGTTFTDHAHGTNCAGVAAARADNPSVVDGEMEGCAGAAPNSRIIAVQGATLLSEEEYADMYLWTAGIDPKSPKPNFPALPSRGADVITNSCTGYARATWPLSTELDATFTKVAQDGRGGLGALMFFPSGNNSPREDYRVERPFAAHPRTFGIGAVDNYDVKAWYSGWGDGLDLCAPSSGAIGDITTTTLLGMGNAVGHTAGNLDYIDNFGGTSSAASLAAGVAALVLSMDDTLTESQARAILTRTADRVDHANNHPEGQWRTVNGVEFSRWYGYGLINAARAVGEARIGLPRQPLSR
jgi:subtilisin family serine protease